MQRGEIMWKRHWQHEDGAWKKVRGMAALEGGKKILWNRHWQTEEGAWEKVRGMAVLEGGGGKKVGGWGKHAWGLASPGSGEARRKVHLQSQPCLSERANKSGGEEKMEKAVIQAGTGKP
jgi:hypothetical protein